MSLSSLPSIAFIGRPLICGLAAFLTLGATESALGQQAPAPATLPSERDQLFDELHRDVAAMERELGVYK